MKKSFLTGAATVLFLVVSLPLQAQFTPDEVAEREKWEEFIQTAEIVDRAQPWGSRQAVTNPWEVTLEKDGTRKKAIWKDCQGRMQGYLENWKWEIAAYRLDKYLGLNMVPPTVEKPYKGRSGSCQLYAGAMSLREQKDNKIETPSYKIIHVNRALYLQRAFDNLIANEDRHRENYRFTEDFRMILIDHSRTFRTTKKFTKNLIYDEKNRENRTFIMKHLPEAFVDKLKSLDHAVIRDVVGEYLTDKEIEAVLIRRDLILDWIDKRIQKLGKENVLY
jgi:hypothetical protein